MFFKRPKHIVFNYQPVFYDEKKERMEKRRAELDKEKKHSTNIKGEFKPRFQRSVKEEAPKSNIKLFLILAFFGALLYYIFINKELIVSMLKYLVPTE